MNPVARLFGSLANALLDLGLPTIRQWLRDRIGPAADVAQVTTDGSLVHLDGVKIPIGPKGLLALERASAAITALGRAGLPEVRLHAFTGVLGFGDGRHWFRAEVSFVSSPDPDESAWIWGDLEIRNATWSARSGSPKTNPMNGHARLFVSSSAWRIEGGRLDGEVFRGRFAGTGAFDAGEPSDTSGGERPLVPPALATAALALEHARVGPFLDAASGLGGKEIAIPSFIPLDAELDGELSWTLHDGARAELRVASEAVRAMLRGSVGPTGRDLTGRIDAHVRPAVLLRATSIPREVMPREEDTLSIALDVGGDLRRPLVNGTVQGAELGFRLGRPRFVPAVVLQEPRCELFLKDNRAVVRAVALARSAKVTLDLDANVREPSAARGTLRADAIDAAFLRDVVRTLDVKIHVPDHLVGAIDFTLAPAGAPSVVPPPVAVPSEAAQLREVVASRGPRISGALTLSTESSKLAFEVAPDGAMRIAGGVTARDLVATGVFAGAVAPLEGDLVVALDVVRGASGAILRGTAGSPRLVLGVRRRPETAAFVLEGATVQIAIDRARFAYHELRFRAHGGRFVASGTIPFTRSPSSVLLDLALEEGGAELAEALAQLARRRGRTEPSEASASDRRPDAPAARVERPGLRLRIAHEGARPPEELWLPRALSARGRLRLLGDASLGSEVTLRTPSGTAIDLGLVLSSEGYLEGTTLQGTVAVADAIVSGALGPLGVAQWDAGDHVEVDVLVGARTEKGSPFLVAFRSERLSATIANAALVLTHVSGAVRVDAERTAWCDVNAAACGGRITSSGLAGPGEVHARVSFSQVAVHDLPPFAAGTTAPPPEGAAQTRPSEVTIASFVRGRLSGSVIARTKEKSLHAAGDVVLEDAAFPALDRVRPALARYGLRPPNEDAAGPVTATIVGTDWGISARDVKIDLRGASVRGEIGLSRERVLDGHAEVVLEEEYLRTSKLLTLPRVLTDRLVLPVRVEGTLEHPRVHAGIAGSLGRFLKDNRVSAFVTSAVEEAQLLLGRHPIREPAADHERPPHEEELDAILRRALDAYAPDWETIGQLRAQRNARYRVR